MDQKTIGERRAFFRAPAILWREHRAVGLAFLIPFVLMLAAFALEDVYPAGGRQILNYDEWHQYYPFWMQLHDHLREGSSLLYDADMGLGTNFLSLISYYGASPLNLLTVLFAARDLRILFTLLTALRIGLAGGFCAYFLKKVFAKNDLTIAFFGSCYALCGYVTGYYWNVMWLDCVALLPLLTLGLVALFREGKFRLYTLTLALTLFCNYYIAYMCCIFMVLAFF
ncbi:MAG: YfhO family protein, partial [Clostridia bacterium]|nr:YfhO family protein [Clostridia bacterium]